MRLFLVKSPLLQSRRGWNYVQDSRLPLDRTAVFRRWFRR